MSEFQWLIAGGLPARSSPSRHPNPMPMKAATAARWLRLVPGYSTPWSSISPRTACAANWTVVVPVFGGPMWNNLARSGSSSPLAAW